MKNRFVHFLVLSLALMSPALGQVRNADPDKIENIRRLLRMTGMEKVQQGMMDQMIGALKKAMPSVFDQDQRFRKMSDRLTEILNEEFKQLDFTTMGVELYDKYFTADEIKGLIQFYESPIGQKTIQVLPALTRESTSRGIELGQEAGRKAMTRWLDEFPELKKAMPQEK
ncbi:MAG TPA: DUF2059 domain-containing protein [Terriglobia bacterium]|nr:DUF2059 domain-containing protein [Terriglobia bacterium]